MIIPVSGVIKTKLLTKSALNTFTNLIVSPAFVFFLSQFLALCHKGNNGSFPFSSHSTLLLLLEIGVSQNLAKLGEVHIKWEGMGRRESTYFPFGRRKFEPRALALKRIFWDLSKIGVIKEG